MNFLFDVSQKLDVLFRLRLVDEFSGKRYYLQDDQEIMPLFTQAVERWVKISIAYKQKAKSAIWHLF